MMITLLSKMIIYTENKNMTFNKVISGAKKLYEITNKKKQTEQEKINGNICIFIYSLLL